MSTIMANGLQDIAINGQAKGIADSLAKFTIPKKFLDIIILEDHEANDFNVINDISTDVGALKKMSDEEISVERCKRGELNAFTCVIDVPGWWKTIICNIDFQYKYKTKQDQ